MKVLKYVFLILLSYPLVLLSQNNIVSGKVLEESGIPLDYFNATLFLQKDSSLIQGNTFFNGEFELKDVAQGDYILRISSVQYLQKDTIISINTNRTVLPPIYLKGIELTEITVIGYRNLLKQSNGNFTLDINNSYLKDESSLIEILQKSPGVLVDNNNNISIFNKNKTLIYINNKIVRNNNELSLIKPTDVDNIQIINNPSSKYSSDVDAVILISTLKKNEDMLDFSITNITKIGRKLSDGVNFNLISKTRNITNYFTYSYNYNNNKIYDYSSSAIFNQLDTTTYTKHTTNNWKSQFHDILYSFSFSKDDKNTFGFQYLAELSSDVSKRNSVQYIDFKEKYEERDLKIKDEISNHLHNFTFNYEHLFSKSKNLIFISDFAFSGQKMNSYINDYNISDNLLSISEPYYKDAYKIFSTDISFNNHSDLMKYSIGSKYSNINDDSYIINNVKSENKIKDHIWALYLTGSKKISSFNFDIGLRTEYASTQIQYIEDTKEKVFSNYWDLFPFISITKDFSQSIKLSFSYNRKINRTPFSQLNPRYKYLDSLSYSVGNPDLKPSYANNLELNLEWDRLNVKFGYLFIEDQIANVGISESENSDIIKYTFINLDKMRYLTSSINYSFKYSNLNTIASIFFRKPYGNIPFLNSTYRLKKPTWRYQLSMNLKLFKETSINGSFLYQTSSQNNTLQFGRINNLSIGLNQYFLQKKLYLSISCTDILDKFKTNNWRNKSGNTIFFMDSNQDSRKLIITLKFNFGVSNIKNTLKSANQDNFNRL
jgi:hypothetical protein